MSHLVGFHTWSTVSASQKPFRRPNSTTSISTTRHHLLTGTLPNDMENIKQSYYTVRLVGASLFLVGEDATSQLRTPFTNNIHLFNKRLPFHSLPSPMYFNTFPFIFASFHFYLRRFSSVFLSPNHSFWSPKLRLRSALSNQSVFAREATINLIQATTNNSTQLNQTVRNQRQ